MRFEWMLPVLYALLLTLVLVLFQAEYGWQSNAWFWISLPASLISLHDDTNAGFSKAVSIALFQYWALGFCLDRRRANYSMKLKLSLPLLYLLLCAVAFLYSGAGHGPGIGIWFWGSLPVSLIWLIGDLPRDTTALPSWLIWLVDDTPAGMLVPFVASILQYWGLGVFLDRRRKK